MTQEQRDNLKKLAVYLLSDNLKADFDMKNFAPYSSPYDAECGTVGCAVGHGPYAGIQKKPGENWTGYAIRAFGLNPFDYRTAFIWLFGSPWRWIDNTPSGAAKRIIFFLLNDCPTDFPAPDDEERKITYEHFTLNDLPNDTRTNK